MIYCWPFRPLLAFCACFASMPFCPTYKPKIPCNDDRSAPGQIMIFLIKRGEYARTLFLGHPAVVTKVLTNKKIEIPAL